MRRFLTISFMLLALAVSAAGVAPAARAAGTASEGQTCDPTDTTDGGSAVCESGLVCATDSGRNTCQQSSTQQPVDPKAAEAAAKVPGEESSFNLMRKGLNTIMWAITGLFAWLVGVAALMLNYAMLYTVVDMGGYVKNLSAIDTVWEILRDIGNIFLLFGFLAIGISIILDSDWYGGGKKLLPTLLIAAVFVNFSLFAAEAVIDVGNLFATQIYKQINGGNIPNPNGPIGDFKAIIEQKGVAGVLMTKLGLPAIYGSARDIKADGTSGFSSDTPWYMGFMSIILFIVAAFVMFALAFILISRFIVLILLIMVSPIGVAGMAVPGLQGWAKKWWDTLFQQTIIAPILLLMLYIALSVIVDPLFFGFGTTTPAWGGIDTANFMGFAGTLLSYLIAMGLLLAVVYFAKNLSAVGAGWATKTAGKLSFGATAFVGRRTVGRLSNYTARKIRSSSLGRSETGRLLAGVADRGAKASFDVRGTSALKNIPGGGISAGEAQKGGYRGTEDKAIKARVDYANTLGERKQTDAEKQAIHDATQNREQSERVHVAAKDEHKLTEDETIKLRAEVKHLENLSIKSPETDRALGAAQLKLATSETSLATASTKLTEAAKTLATDKKAEKDKIKEIETATSKKGAKSEYAEALQAKTFFKNVSRKPYDYPTVAGSARREAAEKIKTSKPTKDQLADLLKKMQKEEEEEEANKTDKDKNKGEDKSGDKKDAKEEKAA